MKINFITINIVIVTLLLIIHTYTWSMNYKQQSIIAAEHNRNSILLSLPNEILHSIFAYSVNTSKPLATIIKPSLVLLTVCKSFNVETMGKICQSYSPEEKNSVMENLLRKTVDRNYSSRRNSLLLLTYAGAQNDAYKQSSLLKKAVLYSDKQMVATLLAHNINPHQRDPLDEPIFFCTKTFDIAEEFIKRGIDLNIQGPFSPNIIWSCLTHGRSPILIEKYFNYKINIQILLDGQCLFHQLARYFSGDAYCPYNRDQLNQIITLFLKKASDIINTLDRNKETPLDIALKARNNLQQNGDKYRKNQIFISLLKMYGAKTAQELKQDAVKKLEPVIQSSENLKCCICYEVFENSKDMINIPCKQVHADRICITCYQSSLKFSQRCPLCRGDYSI